MIGATDRSRRARPVTSSASAILIRRPTSVMHQACSSRGVPLPIRPFAAWPAGWSFPLPGRQRSWGFNRPFAGLLPHSGGRSSLIDRAHVPVRPSACPIDFRRVICASVGTGEIRTLSDWLLGLAPSAVRVHKRFAFPLMDRSCHGLHTHPGSAGTSMCIRTGSTPPGSPGLYLSAGLTPCPSGMLSSAARSGLPA
jgi:hypothetical protein